MPRILACGNIRTHSHLSEKSFQAVVRMDGIKECVEGNVALLSRLSKVSSFATSMLSGLYNILHLDLYSWDLVSICMPSAVALITPVNIPAPHSGVEGAYCPALSCLLTFSLQSQRSPSLPLSNSSSQLSAPGVSLLPDGDHFTLHVTAHSSSLSHQRHTLAP